MIPINAPQIGNEEIQAAIKVMKSGRLTHGLGAGEMVCEFEAQYAEFVKARHAIAANTGTSALHMAIVGAGIGQGDEIILPSFTFVATAEVVVLAGAKPVFVDIDPETYNIAFHAIKDAVTIKTKAIMPVDLYGLPADIQPIRELADRNELLVLEDAAQAHGASYKGKPLGAFADIACWSFYASKNMTTGEGGMITTNDEEMAEKTRSLRSHGEKEKYKSLMLGHNYHMPEIQAAIGLVQLKRLPEFLAKRRRNAHRLSERLRRLLPLQLPEVPKRYNHSWYLYTLRLRDGTRKKRDKIVEGLRKKGIGSEVYYANPVHLMPYYRKFAGRRLPETEKAARQVFSLPVHPGVTTDQIDFIGESVQNLVD